MPTDKTNSLWLVVAGLFLLVIVASSIFIGTHRGGGQAIEILPPPVSVTPRQIDSAATPAQQVDINRAEAWLLEALPGIGEIRARDIIEYRRQNGPFARIEDLLNVPGITTATFDKIKGLIGVGE